MLKRLLLTLLVLAGSVRAATIANLSPTVMKVTVGSFYCTAYFHYPNYRWDFEMACYDQGGTNTYIQVNTASSGVRHDETVTFSDGSQVSWQLIPNTNSTYSYQIAAQDTSPVFVAGTL